MSKRNIVNQIFGVATIAMMLSAAPAFAQTATKGSSADTSAAKSSSGSVSKGDQKLIRDMAYANISEIETAKLALKKTQNQEVRTFAQQMIDDHTKALQQLQQTAQAKGVELPTEPDMKHKAAAKALSGLTGDAFDRAYMKQAGVSDHQNTHKLLQKVESKGDSADIKTLAEKALPVVDEHLSMAQKLNASVSGKGQATGSSGTRSKSRSGTEDASGLTPENKAGKMSPSGQNETSSVKPSTPANNSGK